MSSAGATQNAPGGRPNCNWPWQPGSWQGPSSAANVAQDRLTQVELELAERETRVLGNTTEPCRKRRQAVAAEPAPAEAVTAERAPAEAGQSPAEAEPEPEEADWI